MNHDNQKDVQLSTTPKDDAAEPTAEPSEKKRELTDGEIASVAAGFMMSGPISPQPPSSPHASPQ